MTDKIDKLLVITYNEDGHNFTQDDVKEYYNTIDIDSQTIDKKYITKPLIIVVCTQKSKLSVFGSKNFQDILGTKLTKNTNLYTLVNSGSFENIRTRVYQLSALMHHEQKDLDTLVDISLKKTTITVTKSIMTEIKINRKNICIVNADFPSGEKSYYDRQKYFMELIIEFELVKKFINGYNIIFCGSLNFDFNIMKLVNESVKYAINISNICILSDSIVIKKKFWLKNNKVAMRN